MATVCLRGVPLTQLDELRLRREIALISQEIHVFAGPLGEDVRLAGPAATYAEVPRPSATSAPPPCCVPCLPALQTSWGRADIRSRPPRPSSWPWPASSSPTPPWRSWTRRPRRPAAPARGPRTRRRGGHRGSRHAARGPPAHPGGHRGPHRRPGTPARRRARHPRPVAGAGGGYSRLWRSWSTPDPVVPKRARERGARPSGAERPRFPSPRTSARSVERGNLGNFSGPAGDHQSARPTGGVPTTASRHEGAPVAHRTVVCAERRR